MKYSRKKIDKAGYALIGDDPFKRQEAVDLITDWRQSHLPVLRELNDELTEFFVGRGIMFEFSSNRIKRMPSIIVKLNNNENMGLGGLQDIGGIRFVFSNIDALELAMSALEEFSPKNFRRREKIKDYIAIPKCSGYRSVHYFYQYVSDVEEFNDLQIELQIRTKLQHSWAMAVETASLISGTSLKASIEDGSVWRDFFKLISAIFSKRESRPVLAQYADYTDEQLCTEYFTFESEHKLIDTLKALRVVVNHDGHKRCGDWYCLLIVNYASRRVNIRYYETKEEALASEKFSKMEQSITSNEVALLVSMEKIEELQKAYPSYFLDTQKFIEVVAEFENNCKLNEIHNE